MVKTYFATKFQYDMESMSDKLFCLRLDLEEEGLWERKGRTILGYPYDIEGLHDLEDECNELLRILTSRKVTGKEYGRIKEISEWRRGVRYTKCLASGMSEHDASEAFNL